MSMDPAHRSHDELLIVRNAAGDADPSDRARADRQLAACADCQALFADIRSIRASTVATVLRVPPRPRSFRIPAGELERLRVPHWRRLLDGFGAPSFDFVRPLGTVVAGLGVAVILLGGAGTASLPLGQPAFAPGPASEQSGTGATPAATQGATTPASDRSEAGPSASPKVVYGGSGATAAPAPSARPLPAAAAASPTAEAPGEPPLFQAAHAEGGPSLLTVVGLVLIAAGIGALVLNLLARRFASR